MGDVTGKSARSTRRRTVASVGYLALTIAFAALGVVAFVIGVVSDLGFGYGIASVVPFTAAVVAFDRFQTARTGRSPRLFPQP